MEVNNKITTKGGFTTYDTKTESIYSDQPDVFTVRGSNGEIIRITNDGDFYINGKYVDNSETIFKFFRKYTYNEQKSRLKEQLKSDPEFFQEIVMELRREKIEKLLNK